MKVICPQCGSTNLKRLPGAASNGWKFIKAGIFIFLLAIVLPIAIVPMTVMAIVGMVFGGIGFLTWLFGIGRGITG